jgi:hypothetical protein
MRAGVLLDQELFDHIAFGRVVRNINGAKRVHQKNEKNDDEDKFKKENIKMPHHPAGSLRVPLPNFIHKI